MNFSELIGKTLFKDTAGNKSLTATAFIWGCFVVNIKLLASGLTFGGYTMSAFTGSDYGMALAALGAIYVLRRNASDNNNNTTNNGDKTNV
jgi:hypothetical protein